MKSKDNITRLQGMARASWIFPIVAIAVTSFIKAPNLGTKVIVEIVAVLLTIMGLGCGIATLLSLRKAATKGIILPALIGITISSLLLFIGSVNFFRAIGK